MRAAEVHQLARYEDLTAATRVGVYAGTTGEARLLEMTGITDADGVLLPARRVATREAVVTDGSASYAITAGGATAALESRQHFWPPDATMPQVVYLADEEALFAALARDGSAIGWAPVVEVEPTR